MGVFIDKGTAIASILHEAISRAIVPEHARRVLAAFPSANRLSDSLPPLPSPLIEPISERKREVLRYIAEGFTNHEIAARLYLSLYTVKAHARSIYDKLDVHTRTQAVAKARELGLLT